MPTATTEPTQTTETKPAIGASLSDALDAALGTSAPVDVAPPKTAPQEAVAPKTSAPEPTKATEAPAKETSATPSFILNELGKIGLEEKTEEKPAEAKSEEPIEALPEGTTPAAQTAFAKLTKELRDAKTKLKEFETKISN